MEADSNQRIIVRNLDQFPPPPSHDILTVYVYNHPCHAEIRERICRALSAHYHVTVGQQNAQDGDERPQFLEAALAELEACGCRLEVGEPTLQYFPVSLHADPPLKLRDYQLAQIEFSLERSPS